MDDEQIIPASEKSSEEENSPKSEKTISVKSLMIALAIIIFVVGAAGSAYFLGKRGGQNSLPQVEPVSPTPTLMATPEPSPSGGPKSTPKPTKTPTPTPTAAATSTPTPTPVSTTLSATASLDGWRASNNGGNNTWYIQVGRNTTLTERGYVSFDLSSLPSGANIIQATLRLYQFEVIGVPYSSNSILVDHLDYGTELDSSDYAMAAISTNIGTLTSNPTIEWKDLNLADQVKVDRSAGRTRSQFRLRFVTEATGPDAWARFESADNYGSTGKTPQLVIKYN